MSVVRRLLRVLFFVLALLLAATTAAALVSQTAWFKTRLRSYVVREANQFLNGQLSIGRLGGNLFSGIALEQVAVTMDGEPTVTVQSIQLSYDVLELLSHRVSIGRITLNRPMITLSRKDDTWSIARLVKQRTQQQDSTGKPWTIAVGNIDITDGSVMVSGQAADSAVRLPHRIDHLDANLAFKYQAARSTVDLTKMSFRASEPSIGLNALSGSISVDDSAVVVRQLLLRTEQSGLTLDGTVQLKPELNVKLAVAAKPVSLPELAAIVPAVNGIALEPSFDVTVNGPVSHLAITLNVGSAAGQVSGTLVANLAQPNQVVSGELELRDFNVARIIPGSDATTNITGKASLNVEGAPLSNVDSLRLSGSFAAQHLAALGYAAEDVAVRAQMAGQRITFDGRARAYGTGATATGFVTLKGEGRPLTYGLQGMARHLDLRRLPRQLSVPAVSSDLNAAYEVRGTVQSGPGVSRQAVTASGRLEASTLEGMRIADGGSGGVTVDGPDVKYWGDAVVTGLNLKRLGTAFNVPALGTERFDSSINGHVMASGQGTTVQNMTLTASGTLTDSSLLGAHVGDLTFDTALQDDGLKVTASGNLDTVDLKAALQQPSIDGQVNGSLSAQATITNISAGVSADHVNATARVDLHASKIGKLVIDRASFDGDYESSRATIRTFDVAGPLVEANMQGQLALDESGESDLTFHAATSSLEEVGKLIDKPLAGVGTVDGTVTGNKRALTVAGHASGNGLKYGTNGALVLASDYTVQLPNLNVDEVSVKASTNATFITVAGQDINELAATTDYSKHQLGFDGVARQPNRRLSLAGSVTLQTDQQEVRLERLDAETQGLKWQLAPNAKPVVRYADNAVALDDFRLRSGDQQITAAGKFGHEGDALDITLDNADLAAVDAVLLRPPQLSGRLHASAHITGTAEQPQVRADFQVTQGGFRQFHYADLSGTTNYGGKGLTIDAKLQQDAAAWLSAKGYLPLALLKGPGNVAAAHGATAAPEDSVNLHIESSAVQLGVIQGFTTALTNVTGTVEANLDITGPASDPHPGGSIEMRDAAFTVGATGVKYSGGTGRIEFQEDRVHIEQLRVVDNQRKSLLVSGDLAFHELALGGVDLVVKADDFKVIDNKLGNLRINSNLHIVGELGDPRIEGDLGVNTGTINLDEILASTGESAYSTTPIAGPDGDAPPATAATTAPSPSVFDVLQMQIHVTVPNDLVIKGADLRVADAPVGLGALNVTLGGDLWVSKTPWDRPRLTGSVNTVRGTYDFQGRRFDLLRDGTLRFDGLDETEPILDIRAERLIQGVRADVNLRGTLRHPEFSLTSTPPLEEADILALIVFNQPANQIGEGQQVSLAQRAQSMALGALAGQLASSIGSVLDLNTFDLQVAPDSGAAAQLTVGQQVSQNLFVKVEQGIGDQSSTNVVIEYQLGNWLLLQSNLREGSTTLQPFQSVQGSGVDLIFFFSY